MAGQPNDGTTSKPQSRSGSYRRPGRRLLACCAAPGVPLLDKPAAPGRENARDSPSPDCLSRGQDPFSPAGLYAHNAPHLPPKGLWEMQSVPGLLRRALRARGTTVPGVHRAAAAGGAERGLAAGGRPSPCEGHERPALLPRDSTGSRLEWSGRLTVAAAPAAAAISRTTTSEARSRASVRRRRVGFGAG